MHVESMSCQYWAGFGCYITSAISVSKRGRQLKSHYRREGRQPVMKSPDWKADGLSFSADGILNRRQVEGLRLSFGNTLQNTSSKYEHVSEICRLHAVCYPPWFIACPSYFHNSPRFRLLVCDRLHYSGY